MNLHLLSALAALSLLAAGAHAADPRGRYLTTSGNFEVDVASCGAALCGRVSKVIANHSMSRPGEAMQAADTRDPMGLQLLSNFVADGDTAGPARWRGDIYNREDGKTYSALMSLDERGNLVLRAYVGLPVFGKTQVWQRLGGPESAPSASTRTSGSASGSTSGSTSTGASTTATAAGAAR